MSINNTRSMKKTKDFFNDDFEVIYQEDYSNLLRNAFDGEDDDDYEDVLSTLSELDGNHTSGKGVSEKKAKKRRKAPNFVSPAAKAARNGSKIIFKVINILLRTAALILTAVITYLLTVNFWNNHSAYGDVFRAFVEENYILAAYASIGIFLILFEFFSFLLILFKSKKSDRKGRCLDTGRGLFSFIFIYIGSCLAYMLNGLIPFSPEPLQGVQGALLVYGSLRSALLPLCAAGMISCMIRRFLVR